jgi:choline/glycine/proline betaine transport protein
MSRPLSFVRGSNSFMAISSATLAAIFVAVVLLNPNLAATISDYPQTLIARYFSGYLVWIITIIMLAMMLLAVSPFGKVTLGQDGEKPEFTLFSWFAMLFSAGVGTGILFYGVAEPLFHFQDNPFSRMAEIAPGSEEAAEMALRVTLFHWGLHGWAVYSLVGLCLGYFAFRCGLPLSIRSALYPLLGDRIYGPVGHAIDLLAIFSTLFGIAVTLGLGASQMASGVEYLFGIEATPQTKLVLVLLVSAIATVSAVLGVDRGIRRLSEFNIWLSILLLLVIIVAGPTFVVLVSYATGTVDYFANFLPMGIWINDDPTDGWQSAWTLFYWGWWIAWGPFVGMFIARISRGRSIRQFIFGTLIGPTLICFFWLSVFGATALSLELNGSGGMVDAVNADMTQALFTMFEKLDIGRATWPIVALATTLVITWFVTSSDSGTLVICTIICQGKQHPPRALRIFWGAIIALVTGLLLLAGGLRALQGASTAIAVPFAAVLLLMLVGLLRALWQEERGS